MNDNVDFLQYVYSNAKAGEDIIRLIILKRNMKDEFHYVLKDILEGYKKIVKASKSMLINRKKDIDEVLLISKMTSYISVRKKVKNKENDIALLCDMLVKSSEIYIENIKRMLDESKLTSKTVINTRE